MRRILIPTDFSPNAKNAINYALELFKYEISEFFIMHAYQDEIYVDDALLTQKTLDEVTKIIGDKSKTQLKDIIKSIKKISPNPRHIYNYISSNSTLIDETDKIVNEKNIDIIVMGTRGETNDRKLTFGSHTLQVLKFAQCPVLAIPENYSYTPPKHILFPTNYVIPYKRRELKLLCEMAKPYRAEIDIIYFSVSSKLSKRQEDNKTFVNEELNKNEINFKTIRRKNISDAIFEYIEKNDIDMLVMVNTRHYFIENILFQSVIDKLSLNIKIPFMAMQNMQRC